MRSALLRFSPLVIAFSLLACDPRDNAPADAGTDAVRDYRAEPFEPTDATRAYCGDADDDAIEARITEILSTLTVDEKVALMHGSGYSSSDRAWRVPGNERVGVPGFRMLDGPRGLSRFTRVPATAFPVAMMRGATWDPALERDVGAAIAREVRSIGVDVLLAPTINVLRHPRWGRAQETYGEDSHHMGELGVAFVQGAQAEGVIASAKHFAANSIENTRHEVDVVIDERTLREVYLPHFRRVVIDGRVGSVMSAYNRVNGLYCDQQSHLLTDILRGEWQFAGFVESDWVLGTHGDVDSLRAGLDVEMPFGPNFRRLPAAITSGALDERELDASLRRVLRAQLCFGLDERQRPVDEPSVRGSAEHLALAREVARRGIVLLRNDGGALPIAPGATSIALLGRNADAENIGDLGSSSVIPQGVVTALEGLGERDGVTVTHVPGTTLDAAGEATVRAADVVVIVTGLDSDDEGEADIAAGDRESLALRAEEVALIRAVAALHDRVVVVLEGGSAITTGEWDGDIEALVLAFYPGSEGGRAIADVLFGDVSPSGRLPFSIPAQESDLPEFDNVSHTVDYGYLHGYRHLAANETPARYPFGFGLSYSTFTLSELALSSERTTATGTITATVRVTNTGTVRARETVQAYVGARGSSVTRAPYDLRAFAQVQLDPGTSETVTLAVRAEDLAYWNETSSRMEVEAIEYELRVGTHAEDARLTATFRVE
ncbi:beta-glucosidase [Sandaracinus amylolyticus]|uniref:Beta-glucosidase n=1 Tax=Sandaracinus amylolyticus TaxID=927083 RepID=A0A0F6W9H4_9BACT|nr:glycoside hydrolase family 3 C-terminal domain-containing protein [Sandaracinus amylolyticus]AKF10875.1 Beta-glucosidase [Sandaracinus amylolyticus]